MQMSDQKSNTHDDSPNKPAKRNLPSWMSARDTATDKPPRKKPHDGSGGAAAHQEENECKQKSTESIKPRAKAHNGVTTTHSKGKAAASVDNLSFSNLLDGVVFVLSGFVNPERSTLRSQAQEMGAEYQPDWNSNCTLLICAFPNTPKFRQVEADCGTIVSKEWISECYSQKKLVAIEAYLMHAGKPWRKSSISHEASHDKETITPVKTHKKAERSLHSKSPVSASLKGGAPPKHKEGLSPAEVKKWAINDLNETVSWLENQEERPEPTEVKKIAAEGILTCLQDAIESLEKKQGIREATEQWNFIPRVVKELIKLEELKSSKKSVTEKDLCDQALSCKHIYKTEFDKTGKGYDSDDTIEMTEDEIDHAYKTISSKLKS